MELGVIRYQAQGFPKLCHRRGMVADTQIGGADLHTGSDVVGLSRQNSPKLPQRPAEITCLPKGYSQMEPEVDVVRPKRGRLAVVTDGPDQIRPCFQ